jgi:hypothetical protein
MTLNADHTPFLTDVPNLVADIERAAKYLDELGAR